MPQLDAPPRASVPVSEIHAVANGAVAALAFVSSGSDDLEQHLLEVIRASRDVAAAAEELLRELTLEQQILRTGRGQLRPLVAVQSLRFLGVMRDRLQMTFDGLPLD